jgi:hypothetical protein
MYRRAALSLLALALTASCEASDPGAPAPPPPPPVPLPVTVSVGPDDAAISPLGTLRYQAISSSSVASWVWSLSDDTRGSISDDGLFRALQPGSIQVRACASNAPGICGAAMVTVVAPPSSGSAPAVTLVPDSALISPSQTVEFQAFGSNLVTPGWTWLSLDNATASISDSGVLTARRAGVMVVVACATSLPHYCGSAQVRVQ